MCQGWVAPGTLHRGVQYPEGVGSLRVAASREDGPALGPADTFCRVLKARPCLPALAAPSNPNFRLVVTAFVVVP